MIQLASKNLPPEIQEILQGLQRKIDTKPSFKLRVKKAQSLWKTKGGVKNKLAFEKIRSELKSLCSFHGTCCYCENNEAMDIEHVFPKSFFPENTFRWENYLLACKTCNTHFKLDRIHVLDDNDEVAQVQRGTRPKSDRIAFINPRTENPADYMVLSLGSFRFQTLPEQTRRDENKSESTIEILELNTRDLLVEARKKTARYYFERIDRLTKILATKDKAELRVLLNPIDDQFDFDLPISVIQQEIKAAYKSDIQNHQHPSVWHSIKVIESKINPKWKELFARIPEALTW